MRTQGAAHLSSPAFPGMHDISVVVLESPIMLRPCWIKGLALKQEWRAREITLHCIALQYMCLGMTTLNQRKSGGPPACARVRNRLPEYRTTRSVPSVEILLVIDSRTNLPLKTRVAHRGVRNPQRKKKKTPECVHRTPTSTPPFSFILSRAMIRHTQSEAGREPGSVS